MSGRTEMTVRDLINNPSGPHSRQIAARYTIQDALRAKFVEAMKDPNRRRRFKVAVSRHGEKFVAWIRVPSEKYAVDYDVILQLSFPEGARAVSSADVKVYCNSPGWIFTSAYAFGQAGFLAEGWEAACGRAATEPPKTTNPHEDLGFDKVLHQAILFFTGPAGYVTQHDLQMSPVGTAPDPKDPRLSAQSKLQEYGRAKAKYDAIARTVKRAEKAQKEETERKEKMAKRAASTRQKAAATAKAAKASRTVANVGRRKTRSAK
jgi:hypothetical protein